ncbi:Serine/threonine protein kinase PknB [Minicystis rosea]|nr:Serine/threonine protein kinase PknB [Minicystis rosea]
MDPELEAQRRVGTTLCNKWTLERLIGTGGMAAVYIGAHKIGRREAIKILHTDVARDAELRARFEQEAHAVNRFKHPGTVEIRDIDVTEDGAPFLVMELLEGEPLSAVAKRPTGVALPDLLRWIDELLDVLAAAHAQGIIHRDVKPDNLFVMKDGHLKVLDFGIARVRAGAPKLLTRLGATLGTAPYMPPEQIRGQEIDARADIFAVGATMFRILARRRIHEAANEQEMIVRMASEPAPPFASVAPDVPRDIAMVIDRALKFDRTQRYPDAITMQRDVRALRDGVPPPHAHARLLEATPAPSALRAAHIVVPTQAPMTGEEPTAFADGSPPTRIVQPTQTGPTAPTATLNEPTAAASPVAIFHSAVIPPQAAAQTPIAGAPDSLPDPTTRPRDPGPTATNGGPPSMALDAALLQMNATPPASEVMRPPGANTTLRSANGPNDAVARANGYAVSATAQMAAAAPASIATGAPSTTPAGTEPLAPGASIPVVQPSRRRTIAGAEPNVALLILVGIAFAALGVGLTLWLMLRGTGTNANADAGAAPAAESPDPVDPWPRAVPRSPSRTAQPSKPASSPPQQQQPQQQQPQQPQVPLFPPLQQPQQPQQQPQQPQGQGPSPGNPPGPPGPPSKGGHPRGKGRRD